VCVIGLFCGHNDVIAYVSGECVSLCNTLQHTATHCNTLQHTATHCNTLQYTATHCNTLQYTAAAHYITLQHTATHCITLQYTAAHYITLQHTATHCNTLQYTAAHCNTLQHTATHCNTLQHQKLNLSHADGYVYCLCSNLGGVVVEFKRFQAYSGQRGFARHKLTVLYILFVCVCGRVCVCMYVSAGDFLVTNSPSKMYVNV